jgi:deoxycytidine triphosphate deaminase/intein/homing endonuclease
MSIKSDRWIRQMSKEHGMIEPFSEQQVRVANGHRIVSYGTSSYGYDVRCAEDFKIFTNINSTIVDPKAFDEKSFVDFRGPVCIIPPNSFALASTVEYFRIPRSVLTVCLGKCVTGDTRVVDADTGAYLPITEMRWGKSTLAWNGRRLERAKVSAFIPQGKREVFELRTRSGLKIRATANHPFLTLNKWTALSDLKIGDRIAVARDMPVFGKSLIPDWEANLLGLMISEGQCSTPGHSPTYTTADPVLVQLLKDTVASSGLGEVTFKGRYGYRLVNRKGRGGIPERNRAHEWLKRLELNVGATGKFVPQSIFMAPESSVRLFLQSLFSGDGSVYHSKGGIFVEYYSSSRRLIEDVHHLLLRFGIFSLIREKITHIGTQAFKIQITDKDQILRFAQRIGFVPNSIKQLVLEQEVLPLIAANPRCKSNFDTLPREAWNTLIVGAHVGGYSMNGLGIHVTRNQSVSHATARKVAAFTGDLNVDALIPGPVWDTVEKIESFGVEEVFDITVPGLHNFVANDFIIHNSTYARCFSGDTRVALANGTAPTLEEMARRYENGEIFRGYSIAKDGRLIVSLLDAPRFIGRDSLLEIELDNGARIHATPDHQFIRRDGQLVEAHMLRPQDSLMPLDRNAHRGEHAVYQPADGLWYLTEGMHRFGTQQQLSHQASYRNHKVAAIREIPGDHDVYCLTVPEAGNFALEAGVFVKNCGIIVNVTPLEPEWEGHVTLEFSNTTPLPAKIYANEGVAQMLFFESDEVCETSYKDRGGKYQGQRGVTLPKT